MQLLKVCALASLFNLTASQLYDSSNSITALTGSASIADDATVGNYYNYWLNSSPSSNRTTWDLTRSDRMAVTSPKTIPFLGQRAAATIEPSRSALVIIDMQNFFLHPKLSPHASGGRTAVTPTLNMIKAFRANGMKVLWTNWGLDNFDLVTIPPSFIDGFSNDSTTATSFGADMGTITDTNGTVIQVGRKLMRGSWNAQPWGDLYPAMVEGMAAGTDLYFNKNRLSGLWGAQTPLGLWLQENEITTLFFGGVNADQCVWGTLLDAYYKGFDVVYVDDVAATVSPFYATQMVRYNADLNGFFGNSTQIIDALS
ncbi:hypothetical protein MMC10_001792 [Thelotrema lepadinum]|nr:hypothetical protein [Thelotrema lepadinum]